MEQGACSKLSHPSAATSTTLVGIKTMDRPSLKDDWAQLVQNNQRRYSPIYVQDTNNRASHRHILHCVREMLCIRIPPFPPWRQRRARDGHGEKSSSGSSDTEPLDLFRDEGCSVQDDIWRQCVAAKTEEAKDGPTPFHHELAWHATFQSALKDLTDQYTAHGLVARIPRIKAILSNLQPFVAVVSAMVQSNPGVAALVWGSTQLILSTTMRMASVFDDMGKMLLNLTKLLPRFEAYVHILPTPRLHDALREVYGLYIDFAFLVIKFLNSNKCYAMFRVQWSAIGRRFDEVINQLQDAKINFDAEVSLASCQIQAERHRELLERIPAAEGQGRATVTTVLTPRNKLFTGRDAVLISIHAALSHAGPETDESPLTTNENARRSCVLRAVAGMGKTETALEYTYRYRRSYSHIFWLHSQSETTLLESFVELVKELGLDNENLNLKAKVRAGLDWLRTSDKPWLLVFDNAESFDDIRQFWPAGEYGSILLTSQNPAFASICDVDIPLQPMTPEEGCSLIQLCLRRGKSESRAGEALSLELGGLPLAIAHFSGYVVRSQCTIDHILDNLRTRLRSSQIWKVSTSETTNSYAHTLATVWNLAWERLPEDARAVLRLLAFLNPDSVPEVMFIGQKENAVVPQDFEYFDPQRFNEAVRALHERHLVERDFTPLGVILRTHRVLQQSILRQLDEDIPLRKQVFDTATKMVRNVFPTQSVKDRGDPSNWAASRVFIIQVISLNAAFTQSEPRIADSAHFAELLSDAGNYLFNDGVQAEAVPILETSEAVCNGLIESDAPQTAIPILTDTLGILQIYNQFMGEQGRRRAFVMTDKILKIRLDELKDTPPETWTETDTIKVARSYVDRGCARSQLNMMVEAGHDFDKGLEYYSTMWTEATLPARFGHLYSCRIWALATTNKKSEAVELANRAVNLITQCYGEDHHLAIQTKFRAALVFFTVGNTKLALEYHKDVFERRRRLSGPDHQETLASQYNLAVAFYNTGDLENAEYHLRENLAFDATTMQWRTEDISRSKFRLSIVLRAQNRPSEAANLRQEALQEIQEVPGTTRERRPGGGLKGDEHEDGDDKLAMEWYDLNVALWHGRTTGSWSDGEHW